VAWRGLHISRPSKLRFANGQIVVSQDAGETRLALEDLAWLVIDTPQASLTAALLSACMQAGIAIIVTDERHMPNGIALPFHTHHRQAAVAALQLGAGEGLRNRLWQSLVRRKIANQAAVLHRNGRDPTALHAMANLVRPGDPDNVEARAARHYWGALFSAFVREDAGDPRNAMLNYGYAVLRGAVARALVAAGFLPSVGLHHASQLNPFNLADDIIEPFRPLVDLAVWRMTPSGARSEREMGLSDRQTLAGVLLEPAAVAAETVTVLVATEMAAASLIRVIETNSVKVLLLPEMAAS
jgi:CRISPR-associated protein Cas1